MNLRKFLKMPFLDHVRFVLLNPGYTIYKLICRIFFIFIVLLVQFLLHCLVLQDKNFDEKLKLSNFYALDSLKFKIRF